MKKSAVILLASGIVFASGATAAPVARKADLTLSLILPAVLDERPPWYPCEPWYCPEWPYGAIKISSTGATVTVDSAAGTLSIAAGAVSQTALITVPVTSTTAFASVKALSLRNLSGVFSLGGGAVTSPTTELPCPSASPVAPGIGCITAGGSNLGGQMGLSGTLFIVIVPGLVTVPVPLAAANFGVGGFARIPDTPAGLEFNAAPWTQGKGKVAFTTTSMTTWWGVSMYEVHTMSWITTATTAGAGGTANTPASGTITLVSPTYMQALGNLAPAISKLQIHFVPEPGTAVLLVAGLAGLAASRRRRSLR